MNNLVVIVEGETEQAFVRDQLAAHLALHGVNAWPVLPGRRRQHGGVKQWQVARQDIVQTLKERRFCSTMFDYYALPDDWPGRTKSRSMTWDKRASHVEQEIQKDISSAMGTRFPARFFVPYVQLHEFEALAFTDIGALTAVVAPLSKLPSKKLHAAFAKVLTEFGHTEAINDGYDTCPSRRIAGVVPAYKKRVQGPIVTARIGLDSLRKNCTHFASWLKRLESIGKGAA